KGRNSWFLGDNIPGKNHVVLFYFGGVAGYRKACAASAENGYAGWSLKSAPETLRGCPQPACTGRRQPFERAEARRHRQGCERRRLVVVRSLLATADPLDGGRPLVVRQRDVPVETADVPAAAPGVAVDHLGGRGVPGCGGDVEHHAGVPDHVAVSRDQEGQIG